MARKRTALDEIGMDQAHRGDQIGAVGIADEDGALEVELFRTHPLLQESGEGLRFSANVGLVELGGRKPHTPALEALLDDAAADIEIDRSGSAPDVRRLCCG